MKIRLLKMLIITTMCILGVGCTTDEKINLKIDELHFEYGDILKIELQDYLDNTEEFINEITYTTNIDNDLTYPNVGEYYLLLKHGVIEEQIKVIVEDTTAPIFIDLKETYNIVLGEDTLQDDIQVYDLSDFIISFDKSEINFKKTGTYKLMIIATDEYENITKEEVNLVISEPEVANRESSSNISSGNTSNVSNSSGNNSTTSSSQTQTTTSNNNASTDTSSNSTNGSDSSVANNSSNNSGSSSSSTSQTEPPQQSVATWKLTEAEIISYGRDCIINEGFAWEEEFTISTSGWNTPLVISINWSEEYIKERIRSRVNSTVTVGSLNPQQGGLKAYTEKINESEIRFYIFY